MDTDRQFQHYLLLAKTHGVEEEAEFQRLSKKGRLGGIKSGKTRAAKTKKKTHEA